MSSPRKWTRADLPAALNRALDAAIDRGAKIPVVLRLTEVAGYTDFALLLSARSDRQVRGIVDGIRETLAADPDISLLGSDGTDHYLWTLLDYAVSPGTDGATASATGAERGDFLIHVFYHPVRRHYDLESMWSDAPRVDLELPAEVMDETELLGLAAPEPMPAYRGDLAFGGFADEFADEDEEGLEGDEDFEDEDLEDEDYEDEDDQHLFDEDEDDDSVTSGANEEPESEGSNDKGVASDDDLFET